MPPPPGLVDAKPITEVDYENKILVSNVWSNFQPIFAQGEGGVQDGEEARLWRLCFRLPRRQSSENPFHFLIWILLTRRKVKNLFNYRSWYSWPGGRTILCGKIPKDARQRREMERKDWGVSAQENGAVQVATLTSISRNYCLVTEKHGDIFPYYYFSDTSSTSLTSLRGCRRAW